MSAPAAISPFFQVICKIKPNGIVASKRYIIYIYTRHTTYIKNRTKNYRMVFEVPRKTSSATMKQRKMKNDGAPIFILLYMIFHRFRNAF